MLLSQRAIFAQNISFNTAMITKKLKQLIGWWHKKTYFFLYCFGWPVFISICQSWYITGPYITVIQDEQVIEAHTWIQYCWLIFLSISPCSAALLTFNEDSSNWALSALSFFLKVSLLIFQILETIRQKLTASSCWYEFITDLLLPRFEPRTSSTI